MRLIGDQNWFILDDTTYQENITNYAYSYHIYGNSKYNYITARMIQRDFVLDKNVYQGEVLLTGSEMVKVGDILTYRTSVVHKGRGTYDALPLVDNLEGTQVLLVSVADNPALADQGLETLDVDGEPHFILKKAGQYKNVKVGSHLADRVEIQLTDSGMDTLIYWYLTDIGANSTTTVVFLALAVPPYAGTANNNTYYCILSDEVWLNDHQTHRLYDRSFVGVSYLEIDKHIVTNIPEAEFSGLSGHDPSGDELTKRSIVGEGQSVTYRLTLNRTGDSQTINGYDMIDMLPESLYGYWSKDNVSVTYVPAEGASVQIENGDSWHIEWDSYYDPSQQYLRWNSDFSATIKGTLYIYVTVTFPTGTHWSDYCHAYGCKDLSNTFQVYQFRDEVFHYLSIPAEALLQKGVLHSGIAYDSDNVPYHKLSYATNQEENGLWYYTNDSSADGMVTYYVTLYNSGESRLYLSDIQDVLPEGFTYYSLYDGSGADIIKANYIVKGNSDYFSSLISVSDANQSYVMFKKAYIQASYSENANGQQVVTFSLSNSEDVGNLQYDEKLDKYYLNSGEAVVFAYHCQTNSHSGSRDAASNIVSMPFYDYIGTGANMDIATAVDRVYSNQMTSNNGNRFVVTNGQAALWGMNTAGNDNSTQWLASEVVLYRGGIQPGITKRTEQPFANVLDPITWSIRVSNRGSSIMRGYTLTDVMMKPYQFTGTVSYQLNHNAYYSPCTDCPNLFTFGPRAPGDNKVTITSATGDTAELTVNGGYQRIKTSLTNYAEPYPQPNTITISVRLSRDVDGNEVLSVFFPENGIDAISIPAHGYATMTLQTQNFGTAYSNASFFNTAYITPSADQPFDTSAVSEGNYTIYEDADSVVSEANVAVSFGYATTSSTAVSELNNTSNSASSIGSTNHIVLSDAASKFQYTLTVNNTGGSSVSQAMDLFVLIDNLPQIDDHTTFYQEILRFSDFQVNFDEDPAFVVSVNGNVVDADSYTLQFSRATEFGETDWNGTNTTGWYPLEQINAIATLSLEDMRSFRVVLRDDTGTVIPADAQITVSFNAKVDLSKGDIPPAATAWNSFGYHYSLVGNDTELEASPQKVGVRMTGVPCLVKELQDLGGNPCCAKEDNTFRFVIYQGAAITLPSAYTQEDVFNALSNTSFTVVELTVKAGESASETISLDDLYCYRYVNGSLVKTDMAWVWQNQARYTVLELPLSSGSLYRFGSFNKTLPNNYTFSYNASGMQLLACANICDVWDIQVQKQCEVTEAALPGAVFGLYSPSAEDLISDEKLSEQTAQLQNIPQKVLEVDNITWYLMDIQVTDENGQILWNDLVEDQYYLLELQAPDGYVLNEQPGQVITADAAGTASVSVTNVPQYTLPLTGGLGTTVFYAAGAAMTSFSLLAMGFRKKRRSKAK